LNLRVRPLIDHDIEVACGLGALSGEILRVGCMGYSACPANVLALLAGLGDALETAGADVDTSAGLDAARRALQSE